MTDVVDIENLSVSFATDAGTVAAVKDVSLSVQAGEVLAIEPMTCPPDAFNSREDLILLQPGQTWTGSWGVRPLR